MIALTKILIAALISLFCALTGLNLDGNEKIVKKEMVTYDFDTPQILSCTKNLKDRTV